VGCKESIRTTIIPQPPYVVDTAYGHEPTGVNPTVKDAINDGRVIVNYRGHGSNTSWAGWNYYGGNWSTTNVNSLSNGDRTPVVFNIACRNHRIQTSCLGEAWLKKYPGGAVASLGASDDSYTIWNHSYDKKLFKAIIDEGLHRIGWISNDAISYLASGDKYAKANVKMYLWLGDPATEIWTGIPNDLTVDHPALLPQGPKDVDVTVTYTGNPVDQATVCLYKDGDIYEVGTTNAAGVASFSITSTTEGTLHVTVSKHDFLPYEGQIEVSSLTLSCDTDTIPENTGGTVNFTLNAGTVNGSRQYILLGSLSGTSPGTPLPGGFVTLPLNWDWFTDFVFLNANTPLFMNFLGVLDGGGQSSAQLNLPPVPGAAGITMYYAYTCSKPYDFVSNAVEIDIVN
jgi:hypothetical protein